MNIFNILITIFCQIPIVYCVAILNGISFADIAAHSHMFLLLEPREKKEEWSWSCFPFTSDALPASLGTLGIYSHYMDVSTLSSLLQTSSVKHLKTLSLRTYFRSDQRNMTALREFPRIFSHLRELEIR